MLFNDFIIIVKKPCHAFCPRQYVFTLGNIGELFPHNGDTNALSIKKSAFNVIIENGQHY